MANSRRRRQIRMYLFTFPSGQKPFRVRRVSSGVMEAVAREVAGAESPERENNSWSRTKGRRSLIGSGPAAEAPVEAIRYRRPHLIPHDRTGTHNNGWLSLLDLYQQRQPMHHVWLRTDQKPLNNSPDQPKRGAKKKKKEIK